MDLLQAALARHSVRSYTDEVVPEEIVSALRAEADACNAEGGLNIQIVTNEPKAFSNFLAHYGKFSGVANYIALVGAKSDGLQEKVGYYGERLVLTAQSLGLNTCWVAATYSKSKCGATVGRGEKLVCVIAFGYGKTQGKPHVSKPVDKLFKHDGEAADWFKKGMQYALLAPTAMNQQKFLISVSGNKVSARAKSGFYTELDLGIVKFHFELGAGKENFEWV